MSVDVTEATFASPAAPNVDENGVERDTWGRPKLPTPDGRVVGHTRASSAGKPLEDTTKLTEWKERQVTVGTLQALLDETQAKLAELEAHGFDPTDYDEDVDDIPALRREREVAIGMYTAMAKGIMLKLDEIGPEPDKDLVEESRAWKESVNAIVEQAHAAAGSKDRADLGTYLHSVLDARYKGEAVPPIPERFAARYTVAQRDRDVAAVDAATAGWVELCRERFVVCDTWTIAGTVDSLVLIPIDLMIERANELAARTKASRMWAKNKARILAWVARRLDAYAAWKSEGVLWVLLVNDLKSGRTMQFGGLAYTAQVAAYADAVLIDPRTGERSSYLTLLPDGIDPATVRTDTETSLIVHAPVGTGVCRVYDVPLDEGRAAIAMASDVRAMRNDSRNWLQLVHEVEAPRSVEQVEADTAAAGVGGSATANGGGAIDRIADEIAACTSVDELLAVRTKHLTPIDYGNPERGPRLVVPWTDEHEALAGARAALLKPPAPAPAEVDPVLAEIARATSLPLLRGVYAVHKDNWTPERAAAADAQAAAIAAGQVAAA